MDQVKIGKFIADCRKKENLTQMQLAEKLNITDTFIVGVNHILSDAIEYCKLNEERTESGIHQEQKKRAYHTCKGRCQEQEHYQQIKG